MVCSAPPAPYAAVIGAGPAGLMAADVLAAGDVRVEVFDAMPSVARKFLLAGVGGMNITHSEDPPAFIARYREAAPWVGNWLADWDANALRQWIHGLGVDTFVGSSGRVFPTDMKAAPLLRAWLTRLRASGVRFHTRHRWAGWNEAGELTFVTPAGEVAVRPQVTVLALGGGSWARLGSDGAWVPWLASSGIAVRALRPANCGFVARWSARLSERFAGQPLKQVIASTLAADGTRIARRGECIVTADGLEGSLIYALSAELRSALDTDGIARLTLDLAPDRSLEQLTKALATPRNGQSLASVLRKRAGLDPVKISLLHECAARETLVDPQHLAQAIKALTVELHATRPLDEAISSAGGVMREALDETLMLRGSPGVFCAGEMLDWEAPTGGYLLTACFASGRIAGQGALRYLQAFNGST
ncbi:TIGR03862 family flavoprotein [Halopseudomonas nanhaiensis]|uniref:TIGR03862 family flavoprotein n=1 Tax=Halopseudomonas nanhaiensis TaxID=2830842 RepID=UPI001CBE360E|nr:TIGR03862 family flavoprotein [Halopseudomonas nanhaiensis]UAW97639.1 TIGR03862 family flavoprotein [Halopseudomonas nanhaiensis]